MKAIKIIVSIIFVLVTIILLMCIYLLMNPNDNDKVEDEEYETTTTVLKETPLGYNEVESNEDNIKYIFNKENLDELTFEDDNIKFQFKNNKIKINKKTIVKDVTIQRNFAKFGNKYVFIYNTENFSGILIYNTKTKKSKKIENYKKLYISQENIELKVDGYINFTASIVKDKKIYINKKAKDLCNTTFSDDLIVEIYTIYNVSKNKYDTIGELNYYPYKEENCN